LVASYLANAEQITYDDIVDITQREKCDFRFAHKINRFKPSILMAHSCAIRNRE
jgi:hypothetical protein